MIFSAILDFKNFSPLNLYTKFYGKKKITLEIGVYIKKKRKKKEKEKERKKGKLCALHIFVNTFQYQKNSMAFELSQCMYVKKYTALFVWHVPAMGNII